MDTTFIFILAFSLIVKVSSAQTAINAYARVTNITGNTLILSAVNESYDTYENGERVMILQVQDNVIGTNTMNNTNFGNLASIQSAGLYEFATILSHTELGGVPNSITLSTSLSNLYNTGANSRVQIISYPRLGSPNYTTSNDIGALPWDGNIGGVIVFEVIGQLLLNHNIIADGNGFRGGARSRNFSGSTNCTSSNIYISGDNQYGAKGESIYTNTNVGFNYARAKVINGGGGGSHHNGGGGGGANFSAGGNGGPGYNGSGAGCPAISSAGGVGGISLAPHISNNRVFFGGGGGGGQQNNTRSSAGGAGAGLIYIKANELTTIGSCGGLRISANGSFAANVGNDGAGGGGAGGSIVLNIPTFNIIGSCPLQISANGGDGGSVNSSTHAGGGGGGQGVVMFSNNQPNVNITTTTSNGIGGCNNSSCNSQANPGSGPSNTGVLDNAGLPVELISFEAQLLPNLKSVLLTWITEVEINNEGFEIEHSRDGVDFVNKYFKEGAGSSTGTHYYEYKDESPFNGFNYYRLKQIDFDGKVTYSKTIAIELPFRKNYIEVYPNPAQDQVQVKCGFESERTDWTLYSIEGRIIKEASIRSGQLISIEVADLPPGIYMLRVRGGDVIVTEKVILE